ncbi:hypothetical protein BBL520_10440 [Bifidobacterium breve]|nr:hypothetical protein BBL520_10440 [Bifidobacterium breve]
MLPLSEWFFSGRADKVGEWWWFENSRACLYYFFIVNDCQFIPRLAACVVVGYPGGFDEG